MILFVGRKEQTGFLQGIAEKRGLAYVCTGACLHISETVPEVLREPYDTVIYDVGMFVDTADEIAGEIIRTNRVNQPRIIIYAPGYHPESEVIEALMKSGIRNFILAAGYGTMQAELEKCLAGYYDVNDPDILYACTQTEEKKERPATDYVTIGVAGTQSRIGTTTQAMQIIKFLTYQGYRACYISVADANYPTAIFNMYAAAKKTDAGIHYQGIDLYAPDTLSDLLKMDYDFYVFDYGSMESDRFQSVSFLEKNIPVIVAGIKPGEIEKTECVMEKQHYLGAYFLFSFVPETEQEDVLDMMGERKDMASFTGYTPDLFSFSIRDISVYEPLFAAYPTREKKNRFRTFPWFPRKKKEKA